MGRHRAHMSRGSRAGPSMRMVAALVSLLVVSFFVYRGSSAAFSDPTDNVDNTWAAGSVALTNDPEGDGTYGDATTAEFNESDLIPGDPTRAALMSNTRVR